MARTRRPRRQRDYKAEYARRKARGLAKGLSVQQARGHKAGEHKIRAIRREQRAAHSWLDTKSQSVIWRWASHPERTDFRYDGNSVDRYNEIVADMDEGPRARARMFRLIAEQAKLERDYRERKRTIGRDAMNILVAMFGVDEQWFYYH